MDYGDNEVQSYTFDPMGNRLTKVVNNVTEGCTYNNANMLLTRGTASYTNDENGNRLTDGAANRTMTWDSQNRMASCAFNGTTSTFTYGADGLRRRMVTGTNTTDYLLDGQSVVREIKNGVVNATYLNGPRGPEYKRDQNGAVRWYLYDGLGSVVGLVDESGNVTNSRKYDVYGAPRNPQSGSAHCFVGGLGHTSDSETGLIYMRARYMDPATGRFASQDPGRHGSNWFAYGECSPANKVDFDGKMTDDQVVNVMLAIAFALAAGVCILGILAQVGVVATALAVGFFLAFCTELAGALTKRPWQDTLVAALIMGVLGGAGGTLIRALAAASVVAGLASPATGAVARRQGEVAGLMVEMAMEDAA